jgi:rSAM/selenodomain-associated transferase 1
MRHENHILLFVKYPEKGKVKSRLAADFGEDVTVCLYRAFIEDVCAMLTNEECTVDVFYHPLDRKHEIMNILGSEHAYVPQWGGNLGDRMKNAFFYCFSRTQAENAILMGSDIPDLTGEILHEACAALGTHDAVIGPSLDGGYYLIGFNRHAFLPRVFDDIPWSTDTVFARTMQIFHSHRRNVHHLAPWRDIDKIDDLRDLIQRHKTTDFSRSKTISYLREINLFD